MKKPTPNTLSFASACTLLLAVAATPASGLVIYSTGFEPSEGYDDTALAGQNGWTAPAGHEEQYSVVQGGLSYGTLPGGMGHMTYAGTDDNFVGAGKVSQSFTPQTDTLYIGLTMRFSELDPEGGEFFFFGLTNGADDFNNSAGFKLDGGGASGLQMRIRNRDTGNGESGGVALDAGEVYRGVLEISKSGGNDGNYDTSRLFLNPTSLTEPGTADASVISSLGVDSLDNVLFRFGGSVKTTDYAFDDLIVATTFAEAAAAVPEPQTVELVLGGLSLGFAVLRRRRQ